MDWNRQMEEMVRSWTEMQTSMWDSWMQSVRRFGADAEEVGGDMREQYRRHLEGWEASVKQALDAQANWARQWAQEAAPDSQAPEVVQAWTARMQEMMKSWTDSQEQLWSAWFESVKELDPSAASTNWEKESRQVMEAWQQAAERAQEALRDWAGMMEETRQGSGGASRRRK